MNIYRETFIPGLSGKYLNLILIAIGIAFTAWIVSIWTGPVVPAYHSAARKAMRHSGNSLRKPVGSSSYKIIVNNDIFRASRKRHIAAKAAAGQKSAVLQVRPSTPLPNLTLLGTIILQKKKTAIISLRGREDDAQFYKVGDTIGELRIEKISKDAVILKRGTEVLTVPLSRPNDAAGARPRGNSYRKYGR